MDQARKKLLDFLESFQTAYQQSAGSDSGAFSLDKLYGDCTELFLSLLDTIDKYGGEHPAVRGACVGVPCSLTDRSVGPRAPPRRFDGRSEAAGKRASADRANVELLAQLVNRALNVAELILKDEKYRRVVASTPELINRVLALLEKLNTTENQKLVLRVIAALGDSTDSKLEIGRRTERRRSRLRGASASWS